MWMVLYYKFCYIIYYYLFMELFLNYFIILVLPLRIKHVDSKFIIDFLYILEILRIIYSINLKSHIFLIITYIYTIQMFMYLQIIIIPKF